MPVRGRNRFKFQKSANSVSADFMRQYSITEPQILLAVRPERAPGQEMKGCSMSDTPSKPSPDIPPPAPDPVNPEPAPSDLPGPGGEPLNIPPDTPGEAPSPGEPIGVPPTVPPEM